MGVLTSGELSLTPLPAEAWWQVTIRSGTWVLHVPFHHGPYTCPPASYPPTPIMACRAAPQLTEPIPSPAPSPA